MDGRWKWGIVAALGLAYFFSSEGSLSYWKKKRRLKELEHSLQDLRTANVALSSEIQRIQKDPRVIEQIARRELGLIQPGEIEYRFIVDRSSGT